MRACILILARVQEYLVDVYEMRKDKKSAAETVDKAIDAAQRSIQINDKSADAHSLLADLYGRKISLGNAMFAGPKFGPTVKEDKAKAHDAIQHALSMNPDSPWTKYAANSLN